MKNNNKKTLKKLAILIIGSIIAAYGITLALEAWREDESNLINNLGSLKKMMDELNHDHIGAMLDTCPMILEKYDGFPRKQAVPEANAMEQEAIQTLIALTNESYERAYG